MKMNNKIYNVILLRVIIYFLRITKVMLHSIIFMSYSESLLTYLVTSSILLGIKRLKFTQNPEKIVQDHSRRVIFCSLRSRPISI